MKSRSSAGYTILEVLIVLLVTTALFTSVTIMFNGRQGKAELEQSVRELESGIQNTTNEVTNGFYPNGFKCNVPGAGPVSTPGGPVNPGGNEGCIFLGKVMAFNNKKDAIIVSVVGRQFKNNSTTATANFLEALPVGVNVPGVSTAVKYKNGLEVTGITRRSNNAPVGALAFMSQLSGGIGAGNPLTGARTTLLYNVGGTATPNTDTDLQIAGKVSAASLGALPDGVTICVKAGRGQRAEIVVGDNNNQTSTFVTLNTGVDLACPTP